MSFLKMPILTLGVMLLLAGCSGGGGSTLPQVAAKPAPTTAPVSQGKKRHTKDTIGCFGGFGDLTEAGGPTVLESTNCQGDPNSCANGFNPCNPDPADLSPDLIYDCVDDGNGYNTSPAGQPRCWDVVEQQAVNDHVVPVGT